MGSPVVIASPRKSPSTGRRTNKPLVEKKRRARINGCLGQLKSLILSAMQTEGAQVSRLEKADILEMTVKYLRHIQRQQVTATITSEPEVMAKFSAGYTECATEVIRYIDSVKCVTPDVRLRLESHLVERLRGSVPAAVDADAAEGTNVHSESHPIPLNPQMPVASDISAQVTSTTKTAEEMSRHYQTAVDLANMAATVTAKEAAAASQQPPFASSKPVVSLKNGPNPSNSFPSGQYTAPASNITRSQSISPVSMSMHFNETPVTVQEGAGEARRRHSSSETMLPPSSASTSSKNADRETEMYCGRQTYESSHLATHNAVHSRSNQNAYHGTASTTTSTIHDYLNSFQLPLHIHIPESPRPPPSPSPPFLHPHTVYPHNEPITPSASAVFTSGSRQDVNGGDEAPPTILYACDEYRIATETHGNPEEAEVNSMRTMPSGQVKNEHCFNSGKENMNYFPKRKEVSKSHKSHTSYAHSNYHDISTRALNCHRDNILIQEPGKTLSHNHRELSDTPSPPTLMKEEFYTATHKGSGHPLQYHHQHHQHSNYLNETSEETITAYNARNNECAVTVLSNYDDYAKQEQMEYNNYHRYHPQQLPNNSGTKSHHHQYHHHECFPNPQQLREDPRSQSRNAATPSRECLAEQVPHTTASLNNGHDRLNGPTPNPRVLSRHNDTSLSPPTLKRRLLLAQESEGDRTAPRCNRDGHSDNGLGLQQVELGLSVRRQNQEVWRAGQLTTAAACRDTHDSFPSMIPCSVRTHSVSADEGLWRPW